MDEVGRSVQRVDDPGRTGGVAATPAGFLGEHAVVWKACLDLRQDRLFGGAVGGGHQVVSRLLGDLALVERPPVGRQRGGSGMCHVFHRVKEVEWSLK